MATTVKSDDFKLVSDPVYTITQQPVNIDDSTKQRQTRIIPPTTGGIGTFAQPLNSGLTTSFTVNAGDDFRMRWGSTALRMDFVFYGADANTAGDPTHFAPPWNLWAKMINEITLNINDAGESVFNSVGNTYEMGLTARMFRYLSAEQLNSMDNTFFTPMFDDTPSTYLAYDDNAAVWGATDTAATKRATRWIGANSNQRTVTKIIPFSILFPQMPDSVFRNLHKLILTIKWINMSNGKWTYDAVPAPGLLEQKSSVGAAQTVCITKCDIITDDYLTSTPTAVAITSERSEGIVDQVGFMNVTVHQRQYIPGSSIIVNGVRNLDCVMIMQPALTYAGTLPNTNGVAFNAHDTRVYSDPCQMFLVGNTASTATHALASADQVRAINGSVLGLQSVQMMYGSLIYPNSPIIIADSDCGRFAELYYHYLKACAKVTRRDVSPAIPMSLFKSTMPFVMLRPWGDNAAHLTNIPSDLTINMNGGVASSIFVVVFSLNLIKIMSNHIEIMR